MTSLRMLTRTVTAASALVVAALVAPADAHATESHADHGHEAAPNVERAARHTDEHGAEHDSGAAGHHDEPPRLGPDELARHAIRVEPARAGSIDTGIDLVGEVTANEDRLAHITPRFAGIVREVRRNVGDRVRKGDVLAVVESSESLAPYELSTRIDGTIVAKHVTRGEAVDRDHEAFVVADLSTVWVRLRVYQRDLHRLRAGQEVRIRAGADGPSVDGRVDYVTPILDPNTRTATARVELENASGEWRPGMFVSAAVLDPHDAAIAVPISALQTIDGRPSVFVVGDAVQARAVVLGRRGRTRVEILAGLSEGERVATTQTFLLKAELGKSEAEHHH
ncbi:MAG: efflux RND transporter periplasmic adaptor subunit [bacterium]